MTEVNKKIVVESGTEASDRVGNCFSNSILPEDILRQAQDDRQSG